MQCNNLVILCRRTGASVTHDDKRTVMHGLQGRLAYCGFPRECLSCALHYIEILSELQAPIPGPRRERPMEMRKDMRYRLDAPAVFSWEGVRHRRFQGEGITRDVSVQGAFILTATMPPPDCSIQLDLLLPSITGMNAMMRITGKARVIRVEHPSADTWIHGFAVVTDDLNQWGLITVQGEPQGELMEVGKAH